MSDVPFVASLFSRIQLIERNYYLRLCLYTFLFISKKNFPYSSSAIQVFHFSLSVHLNDPFTMIYYECNRFFNSPRITARSICTQNILQLIAWVFIIRIQNQWGIATKERARFQLQTSQSTLLLLSIIRAQINIIPLRNGSFLGDVLLLKIMSK